ncbi:MAG: hypothetical protein ACK4Q4_10850, partial [Rhodocyclaceae bacterium]
MRRDEKSHLRLFLPVWSKEAHNANLPAERSTHLAGMRLDGQSRRCRWFSDERGEKTAYRLFHLARAGLRPARVRDAAQYRQDCCSAANNGFYTLHRNHFWMSRIGVPFKGG